MSGARPLWTTSLTFLLIGAAMAALGALDLPGRYGALQWGSAHMWVLVAGFLLPALYFLHLHVVGHHTGQAPAKALITFLQGAIIAAAVVLGGGALLPDLILVPNVPGFVALIGLLLLVLSSILQSVALKQVQPTGSLVDLEKDRLSKGDDACMKHIKMAHRLLPLGLLLLAVGFLPLDVADRFRMAGVHAVLLGYGVLSIYGLGHLLIPRFSGVPAIAAGAIKGELHTTLLGIVGIVAGFLAGPETSLGRGLIVGLGPFVFLGMFVYMGVLGANIMKNKSRTQRVTPEFVYIPWTFTGIFWLIGAVLLGVLINAVPESMSHLRPGLRFTHLHGAALGGIAQLLIGWAYRVFGGDTPPPFGRTRGPFFVLNVGLVTMIFGSLDGNETTLAVGAGLTFLSVAWAIVSLRGLGPREAAA